MPDSSYNDKLKPNLIKGTITTMKNRSVVGILLLTIVTLGIYSIYWQVSTKIEMNKRGATIPTAWLLIVPIVNIWWLWKYSEGVDKETNGHYSTVISFILLFLLGTIGQMIIQHEFNTGSGSEAAAAPIAPVAPEAPAAPESITPSAPEAPVAPVEPVAATEETPVASAEPSAAEEAPSMNEPTAPTVAETTPPEGPTPPTGPVSS